ncbi:MAG TPA: hypothetical protein VJN64_02720 [Terriglobales bacterium]|nr:hypothetical protein [Terriglobales bacterium]
MQRHLPFIALLLLPLAAHAHVNSPDVYYDTSAGPYHLLVTVRPATVVPGVAQIEIRSADSDVEQIKVLPLPMVGAAGKFAPVADTAERDPQDAQLFHGKLWLMDRGSWKVQLQVQGKRGPGETAVPVPAISTNTARMQKTRGLILAILGFALLAGFVSIIGAAARDAELAPGKTPAPAQRRRGRIRAAFAGAIAALVLFFGNAWWNAEAAANARMNYKLPQLQTQLLTDGVLQLKLQNPNPPAPNRFRTDPPDRIVLNDLVPDHGHLMHLFLVRMPDMTSFWHLHPQQSGEGLFAAQLPAMPAGRYRIFADIVHHTGFPETQVGTVDVPPSFNAASSQNQSADPDDSGVSEAPASGDTARLADGYRLVWERTNTTLHASEPLWFRFRLEDSLGRPAQGMEDYTGMAGHAVFLSDDGSVFAHVHPAGSVPMAALAIAGDSMAGMHQPPQNAEVAFPYGFPKSGSYHLFVQVKRAGKVETAVFQAKVD